MDTYHKFQMGNKCFHFLYLTYAVHFVMILFHDLIVLKEFVPSPIATTNDYYLATYSPGTENILSMVTSTISR